MGEGEGGGGQKAIWSIIGPPPLHPLPPWGGELLIEIRKKVLEMNPQYGSFLEVITV